MMCLKCYLLLSVHVNGVCMWAYCHGAQERGRGQIAWVHRAPGLASGGEVCMARAFPAGPSLQLSSVFLGLNSLKAGVEVCLFACLFSGRILLCSPG